ncbi:MAG: VOC family protein [Planctomycetia bacterium]
MNVERVKYVIWAADMDRAARFYCTLFGGRILRQNPAIVEVGILDAVIGIHGGGDDVGHLEIDARPGALALAAGGALAREPEPEEGEPPHLAMCVDPEGNEFMLTRKRSA